MSLKPCAPKTKLFVLCLFRKLLFLKIYIMCFCLFIDRTVLRQEAKWKREWGWDRERSASRDSNTGCLKRNGAACRRAAHKDIGVGITLFLNSSNLKSQWNGSSNRPFLMYIWDLMYIEIVEKKKKWGWDLVLLICCCIYKNSLQFNNQKQTKINLWQTTFYNYNGITLTLNKNKWLLSVVERQIIHVFDVMIRKRTIKNDPGPQNQS